MYFPSRDVLLLCGIRRKESQNLIFICFVNDSYKCFNSFDNDYFPTCCKTAEKMVKQLLSGLMVFHVNVLLNFLLGPAACAGSDHHVIESDIIK